jgi:hypothetical protein
MKKIFIAIVIFSFTIFLGCNKKHLPDDVKSVHHKDFKNIYNLEKGSTLNLGLVTRMAFVTSLKDYIVIHDLYSNGKGIYIVDKNSLELLENTGKVGKGPHEIGRYGNIYADYSKNIFYLADFGKNKIWEFNIDNLLSKPDYNPKEIADFMFYPGIWPLDFIIKNDSLYFLTENNSFVAKVVTKDSIQFISNQKNTIIPVNLKNKSGKVFSTRVAYKSSDSKYAFAFRYSETISITDSNFIPKINIYGKGKMYLGVEKFKDIIYYSHVKADDQFIYAGFMNKPILKEDKKYGNHQANYPQSIRVFNWEGKPVLEIKSKNPFSDFYVDRDNSRVILFLTNKKNPTTIYDVDFNSLLQ